MASSEAMPHDGLWGIMGRARVPGGYDHGDGHTIAAYACRSHHEAHYSDVCSCAEVGLAGKQAPWLIDDAKDGARELLEEIADVLNERYGVSNVVYHRKPSASKPADPDVISNMAEKCDYVVVAIGS